MVPWTTVNGFCSCCCRPPVDAGVKMGSRHMMFRKKLTLRVSYIHRYGESHWITMHQWLLMSEKKIVQVVFHLWFSSMGDFHLVTVSEH